MSPTSSTSNVNDLYEWGNTSLHIAAAQGDVDRCKEILAKDESLLHSQNLCGQTPLLYAIELASTSLPEVMKYLLGEGSDIHQKDLRGRGLYVTSFSSIYFDDMGDDWTSTKAVWDILHNFGVILDEADFAHFFGTPYANKSWYKGYTRPYTTPHRPLVKGYYSTGPTYGSGGGGGGGGGGGSV